MSLTTELLKDQLSQAFSVANPAITTLRVEADSSNGITYVGEAGIGTATSVTLWRIKKITETTVGTVTTTTIQYPQDAHSNPSLEYVFEWDNRATYTYS